MPLITRALALQGVLTTVATTDDDGHGRRLSVPLQKAVETTAGEKIYFRKDSEFYKVSLGLRDWLRCHSAEFDVVHIHALFSFSSIVAARAAARAGVPYVIRPLGVLNRWGLQNRRRALKRLSLRYIELPILRRAAIIHFTAEAELSEAVDPAPEIADLPSAVIPIPIEAPLAGDVGDFVLKFPQAKNKRMVLFLSRIDPKKGLELLLEAFCEVSEDFPEALLVIAGSGDDTYVSHLQTRSEQLGIGGSVIWAGFLAGEDKAAAFAAATAFVLPSHSENFGIAAAEALAAGVPTILSDQVAIAAKANAVGAALISLCNARELAAAIESILTDEMLRTSLSQASAEFVRSHYSMEAVGSQLVELYRRISKAPLIPTALPS